MSTIHKETSVIRTANMMHYEVRNRINILVLFGTATTKRGLRPKCVVLFAVVSVRSPSQHMHIVFLSERLLLLKLACTIYYATWNQKAQRLDCQSGIYPAARAMESAIGVHPCRRILACI